MSTEPTTDEVNPASLTHIVDDAESNAAEITALCGYSWPASADLVRSPFCATCVEIANPDPLEVPDDDSSD